MKRHLLGLALGALVGSFVLVGDAQACHKKKTACAPTVACAPAPVVCEPAPVCAPAPVVVETCAPAPKKHCFKMPKMPKFHGLKGLGCKKAAPVATCNEVVYGAPETVYAAPQAYATPQVLAAPQASAQN
ncbi:hypothetical protein [Planctomyces sp. SH-PL62]|uniref:hypothetical protein n=1 Tax=Planctomyces sp. SH-PL62 TaxID=1636152 RepID=UPI00078E7C9D|nr:hypothetical protein [Planctomyces sp. SH-PL62]AMV40006.1 hypothetical protein VT85_21410 [Planctomyces sp. SH-PL62]